MAFDPLTAVLNIGNTIIDRILPDKQAAAAAKAQLVQMELQGDLDQMKGQLQIDQVEAASNSVFVAGWRPFVGWVCGAALAYTFLIQPFTVAICVLSGVQFDVTKLPHLDTPTLLGLLGTLLGNAALRSVDKFNDVSNGH